MKKISCIVLFLLGISYGWSQTVAELKSSYSGKLKWNNKTKTVRFESTGTIFFKNKTGIGQDLANDQKNHFWVVPKDVKKIIIGKNVTVTGAFHTSSDIFIAGEDRKTSVVFGTDLQTWTDKNNPGKQDLKEWYYSQFDNSSGVLTIQNLTILNPFSYFVRGFGPVVHVKSVDFIDNRGGHHNHSDGFCGGNGSTVDDCYFESGDDVFKAYFNYTVTNCTINMVDNSVPIQLGWGNYSNGAVCTFKNLKVIGNSGRWSSDNAVISGRTGKYDVTINIDGLEIENPNAVMVSLWEDTMTLNGNITNAKINVKKYTDRRNSGTNNLTICNSLEHTNHYDCK
ncbi:hypothetical protein EC396_02905 [Lutibacter sp. HS1-25]|uniref:hypothetical protein n=1 Tax=Lutibacter sp. HS1-25 TaxID=2485000 RepID=UPI00101162DA|nr:hypothetical protein [Lutibacter sp. HS1-25]RXP62683.1 hypothetical protein EC396_02905 [Lutibacter sp. HS1-25]